MMRRSNTACPYAQVLKLLLKLLWNWLHPMKPHRKMPVSRPCTSLSICPCSGSGDELVIPAASRAALFARALCPSARIRNAGCFPLTCGNPKLCHSWLKRIDWNILVCACTGAEPNFSAIKKTIQAVQPNDWSLMLTMKALLDEVGVCVHNVTAL